MKRLMLICAPVTSRSGYGDHARDLVTSFLNHKKYDVKIQDVPWGQCPRNALDKNNSEHEKISNCILKNPEMERQPDIYVDIRIPNEFVQIGKFNIGITAGIETTVVSEAWIEGCNKMDLVIVPSEHSKDGFTRSLYDKVRNLPDGKQQKIGELKLKTSIEVLFEGADENIYKPIKNVSLDLVDDIKEDFCFLHVGMWGKGGYGEDRKDISKLVKVFYESFANKKKQPALVLKTNGATFSILDREDCLNKIKQVKKMFPSDWKLPNVYLLHGLLSSEEINMLYNHPKIKSFVSLTHGEGFGRPLLEATMTGLPVIASAWSGQMDFLDTDDSILIGGDLKPVPQSQHWKDIIVNGSEWFEANENQTYKALNYTFENEENVKKKALNLMNVNRNKFTLKNMISELDTIVEEYLNKTPQEIASKESPLNLNLPKLKKIDIKETTSPKINLPKLKKVTKDEVSV